MPKVRVDAISEEMQKRLDSIPNTGYDIVHKTYTEEEDQIILRYYRIKPTRDLCVLLNRSTSSLSCRVECLRGKGRVFYYQERSE